MLGCEAIFIASHAQHFLFFYKKNEHMCQKSVKIDSPKTKETGGTYAHE